MGQSKKWWVKNEYEIVFIGYFYRAIRLLFVKWVDIKVSFNIFINEIILTILLLSGLL